jgi:hypothetical protein
MNELLIVKNHSECFKVFEAYLVNLDKLKSDGVDLNLLKTAKSNYRSGFSYGQFRVACMSLLCLNTREAFIRMKKMIDSNVQQCHAFLSDKVLISCFLLAFLQVCKF